jgi:cysteinyl-tRNA synthetase
MNLTDVDDKTIRGCQQAGLPLAEFTAQYKTAFFEDLDALRIKRADHFPAATETRYIEKMISMIAQLENDGIAYQAEDKSVYFRLAKFPDYGKLAHLNLEELRPSGRVRSDEYEKESVGDFALWKAWDAADGDVGWESPWGRGPARVAHRVQRHGHCAARAGAGYPLRWCGQSFPAPRGGDRAERVLHGRKFVRYWLHCAHLMVEGQKMSKALGNFYTLRDLLAKGFTGREVRYALLTVNYRLPLNFTISGLEGSRTALARIDEWVTRVQELAGSTHSTATSEASLAEQFLGALDDDLNISAAMGQLFERIRETNSRMDQGALEPVEAAALLQEWQRVNSVLAIQAEAATVPAAVLALVEQRQQVRAAKDWAASDRLRDEIAALGWTVKDTKEGPKLTLLRS